MAITRFLTKNLSGRRSIRLMILAVATLFVLILSGPSSSRAGSPQRLWGLAYSPYRDGQSPDIRSVATTAAIEQDMKIIKPLLRLRQKKIRTYSSTHGQQKIPAVALKHGISVHQGAWLDKDLKKNQREIDNLIKAARSGGVEAAIVGNEALLRKDLTKAQMISYIKYVKKRVNVPVTTAETWNVWEESPALAGTVDFITVHIYPYWQRVSVAEANQFILRRYNSLKRKYPNKKIIIGETGWPSAGSRNGVAIAGPRMQKEFLTRFLSLAHRYDIKYFYFAGFDEKWKNEPRGVGPHWGVLDSLGRLKPSLVGLLPNPTVQRAKYIYMGRTLSPGYDMGVNSSGGRTGWVANMDNYMKMSYPSGQSWGAVFITVGKPTDPPRPSQDFSAYTKLVVDLRGKYGGESVQIGIKDDLDPDNGSEKKINVTGLPTYWKTYQFNLSDFTTADLKHVYVPVEFVFDGSAARTVLFRNVRYR